MMRHHPCSLQSLPWLHAVGSRSAFSMQLRAFAGLVGLSRPLCCPWSPGEGPVCSGLCTASPGLLKAVLLRWTRHLPGLHSEKPGTISSPEISASFLQTFLGTVSEPLLSPLYPTSKCYSCPPSPYFNSGQALLIFVQKNSTFTMKSFSSLHHYG